MDDVLGTVGTERETRVGNQNIETGMGCKETEHKEVGSREVVIRGWGRHRARDGEVDR